MNAAEAEAATVVSSTHFLFAPVRPVNDIVTSFLKSVQRKEPSCFSSIFPPLPGCVKRARPLQNTFSELVLMSLIGPEVSAADHLLPIVIGHDVAATFTPLTPGGGVSQRHPPIFIVSPALALLFNQCE